MQKMPSQSASSEKWATEEQARAIEERHLRPAGLPACVRATVALNEDEEERRRKRRARRRPRPQ